MEKTNTVTEAIAKDALSAVEFHPLHSEAIGWAHCGSDVFEQPKSFIDRARISEEKKRSIYEALEGVSTVLLVSYWTSANKPEPLAGFGKLYAFLVHPETFEVSSSRGRHVALVIHRATERGQSAGSRHQSERVVSRP